MGFSKTILFPAIALVCCIPLNAGTIFDNCNQPQCADGMTTRKEDINVSELNPYPAEPIYQFSILKKILENAGYTPDKGYDFHPGDPTLAARDLSVDDYFAWVVNSPDVRGPDLTKYNVNIKDQDVGGAVFSMQYTPQKGDPASVHFIQVYSESLNGGPTTYHVDNVKDGKAGDTPYYDQVPGASVQKNWFSDEPFQCEGLNPDNCADEKLDDTYASFRFGVFLATDDGKGHQTLYGGYQWGYDYGNLDTPEPGYGVLSGFILLGFGGFKTIRRFLRSRFTS